MGVPPFAQIPSKGRVGSRPFALSLSKNHPRAPLIHQREVNL